jgi:hypothetical protein
VNRERRKALRVLVSVSLVLLALVVVWRWQGVAYRRLGARKPDPIPPGDYSYTVDYAEHRIQQLMKRHHRPVWPWL